MEKKSEVSEYVGKTEKNMKSLQTILIGQPPLITIKPWQDSSFKGKASDVLIGILIICVTAVEVSKKPPDRLFHIDRCTTPIYVFNSQNFF